MYLKRVKHKNFEAVMFTPFINVKGDLVFLDNLEPDICRGHLDKYMSINKHQIHLCQC